MSNVAKVIDQPQQIVPINDSAVLLTAIAQAARDPNVDVDKMERLMAMHRDLQHQASEIAFNEAMARVQANMGRIGADKRNNQTHSDYATYGKLDRVLRPLYSGEGFALSFGTDPTEMTDMVRVTCHVTHRAGFTRKYLIDMPADGKGAKGNDVMTKTHATGSATQYGMRYLLKMIFNVAIGDEDDDGNGAASMYESVQESPERTSAIADLLAVADNGSDAFRSAWASMTRERRVLVQDRMETFKARAQAADAKLAGAGA